MKTGTQIAYIPNHANGDIGHKDVEFGFVTSRNPTRHDHFCRYWFRGQPGVLRTLAISESTPDSNLVEYVSVEQAVVDELLLHLDYTKPIQVSRDTTSLRVVDVMKERSIISESEADTLPLERINQLREAAGLPPLKAVE